MVTVLAEALCHIEIVPAPKPHERLIHDHFPYPPFKTPFTTVTKTPDVGKHFCEGDNQHILAIHRALDIPTRKPKHPVSIKLNELPLGLAIALLTTCYDIRLFQDEGVIGKMQKRFIALPGSENYLVIWDIW